MPVVFSIYQKTHITTALYIYANSRVSNRTEIDIQVTIDSKWI